MEKDFNNIIENLITNAMEANAVKSEMIFEDQGYELRFTLTQIAEEED